MHATRLPRECSSTRELMDDVRAIKIRRKGIASVADSKGMPGHVRRHGACERLLMLNRRAECGCWCVRDGARPSRLIVMTQVVRHIQRRTRVMTPRAVGSHVCLSCPVSASSRRSRLSPRLRMVALGVGRGCGHVRGETGPSQSLPIAQARHAHRRTRVVTPRAVGSRVLELSSFCVVAPFSCVVTAANAQAWSCT